MKNILGVPTIKYETSYIQGFQLIEEKFLYFYIRGGNMIHFGLKIPLNHLDINDKRIIKTIDTANPKNKFLTKLIGEIYRYNGLIMSDILNDISIDEILDYINAISTMYIVAKIEEGSILDFDIRSISGDMKLKKRVGDLHNVDIKGVYL